MIYSTKQAKNSLCPKEHTQHHPAAAPGRLTPLTLEGIRLLLHALLLRQLLAALLNLPVPVDDVLLEGTTPTTQHPLSCRCRPTAAPQEDHKDDYNGHSGCLPLSPVGLMLLYPTGTQRWHPTAPRRKQPHVSDSKKANSGQPQKIKHPPLGPPSVLSEQMAKNCCGIFPQLHLCKMVKNFWSIHLWLFCLNSHITSSSQRAKL